MTQKRKDLKKLYCPHCKKYIKEETESTEFGIWLRNQKEIDSKNTYGFGGYFTATNLDYIWRDYRTGDFILIEEKRYLSEPTYSQKQTFKFLDNILKEQLKYHGFHVLQFEKTNPEDGRIWLDDKKISKEELIIFLRFGKKLNKNNDLFS